MANLYDELEGSEFWEARFASIKEEVEFLLQRYVRMLAMARESNVSGHFLNFELCVLSLKQIQDRLYYYLPPPFDDAT